MENNNKIIYTCAPSSNGIDFLLLKETRTLPIACTMQEGLESKYLLTDRAKSDMEYIVEACNNYDKLKEDNALLLDNLRRLIDRMEENDLGQMNAVKRAKEAIQKTQSK